MHISIYSTDGMKVYETWLEKLAPGSYDFTWDGSVNVMPPPPPPDGLAPTGLYVFDVEVIGVAPGYDEDAVRSRTLRVGEHEIEPLAPKLYDAKYILRSNRDASEAWLEVYDPLLNRIAGPENGPTHAIREDTHPADADWNHIPISADLQYASGQPYRFVFWARDNFPDYDKAHRRKVALTNQGIRNLGWIVSCGFLFPNDPLTPWGALSFNPLDTRELARTVARFVQSVIIPTQQGRTIQGMYTHRVSVKFYPNEDLIYTEPFGARGFAQGIGWWEELWQTWGDVDKAVRVAGWGLIHWAGHGGDGNAIGFPDPDTTHSRDPVYIFATSNPWRNWKAIDINTFPQNYFRKVKVVYLGGCNTSRDETGGGLPQAFVDRGAHAAVGWHVYRKSLVKGNTEPDVIFWASLAGHCSWYPVGSTVEEAAWAATCSYISFWSWVNGYHWRQYMGIAGNASEKLY